MPSGAPKQSTSGLGVQRFPRHYASLVHLRSWRLALEAFEMPYVQTLGVGCPTYEPIPSISAAPVAFFSSQIASCMTLSDVALFLLLHFLVCFAEALATLLQKMCSKGHRDIRVV